MSMSRSRIITIALVCSVAVNLMFVGALIGRFMFSPPPGGAMPMHVGWLVRHLPEGKREELRDGFVQHIRETRPLRREMFAAQREFERAIASPELDQEQLDAALGRLREATETYQATNHQQMVTILKSLSPEERQAVVQELRERTRRDRGGPRDLEPPPRP